VCCFTRAREYQIVVGFANRTHSWTEGVGVVDKEGWEMNIFATLTGGGAFNPVSGFVHSAGGFRCTSDVGQGPLAGCLAGEGVRWDTANLRRSTSFKCTGAAAESLKTVSTDENTVGLDADFYRAGDGNDESFTAQMIVSANDIAPDIAGIQNVWIQGVGCASAIANFSG